MVSSVSSVSPVWQCLAWLTALSLCWLGLQGLVAEWPSDLATLEFGWLLLAPILWVADGLRSPRRPVRTAAAAADRMPNRGIDLAATLLIVGVSLGLSAVTGAAFDDLPLAYHDEYSYLFQAQSILHGRWTWPSSPVMPELFDQMHILNEGRMASRYYPGTGTWLAPWLLLGHPYWGQYAAGAISAALIYWIGRELSGRLTGFVAGIAFAAAPGPALFSNLLLAHHACLLGLMVFLWGFVRGRQSGRVTDFLLSGAGLGFALLCRPATAVGFGLPLGVWCFAVLVAKGLGLRAKGQEEGPKSSFLALSPQPLALCLGYGLPLLAAFAVAAAYNSATTGDWRTSSYQLYTDIYTPRHVYGLNNVVRGEQHLGPKVLDDYDRWAENLTPEMANINARNRLLISALWTIGLPLLSLTLVLSLPLLWGGDRGWMCVAWGVVSLHAVHWPYWYVGIMGWHYVYETAPLLCLLFGYASSRLVSTWRDARHPLLVGWFPVLLLLAWSGMYASVSEDWQSRWSRGVGSIAFPREQHAMFRRWVAQQVGPEAALVLIDQSSSNPHLDLVVNNAGLADQILYGRYRPEKTDLAAVMAAFPHRRVFVANAAQQRMVPAAALTSRAVSP